MSKLLVISTVGTSLLTNQLTEEDRRAGWNIRIRDTANLKADELEAEVKNKIELLAQKALRELQAADAAKRRQLSAELNGVYAIYNGHITGDKQHVHFLIATDTYQGYTTASILEQILLSEGLTVNIQTPQNLSTLNTDQFSQGVKELIRWCNDCIPGYKDAGYEVIFNLVGGFKALHSYMHTIGMFYADRMVYIFEGSNSPINIPRLPVKIEEEALRPYATFLLMMEKGYLCPMEYLKGIFEVLIDGDGRHALLSNWGQLMWGQVKRKILNEQLLDFPHITYSDSFRADFKKAEPPERVQLQETLAKVAVLLAENKGNTAVLKDDGGLQYDNYTNKKHGGRSIGHFRVNDDMRVSCIAQPGGTLLLRRFGHHDAVERDP